MRSIPGITTVKSRKIIALESKVNIATDGTSYRLHPGTENILTLGELLFLSSADFLFARYHPCVEERRNHYRPRLRHVDFSAPSND